MAHGSVFISAVKSWNLFALITHFLGQQNLNPRDELSCDRLYRCIYAAA